MAHLLRAECRRNFTRSFVSKLSAGPARLRISASRAMTITLTLSTPPYSLARSTRRSAASCADVLVSSVLAISGSVTMRVSPSEHSSRESPTSNICSSASTCNGGAGSHRARQHALQSRWRRLPAASGFRCALFRPPANGRPSADRANRPAADTPGCRPRARAKAFVRRSTRPRWSRPCPSARDWPRPFQKLCDSPDGWRWPADWSARKRPGCDSPKIGVVRLFSACWQCVTIVWTARLLATSPCASPPIPSDKHVQVQRRLNLVAVFVVFSDAPEVGARAGLNAQKGPHSAGYTVYIRPRTDCPRSNCTLQCPLRDTLPY